MKTLADEILSILTAEPVSAKELAKTLAADPANVRAAIQDLDASGRARWIVRGKGGAFYIARPDYAMRVCIICHREFVPKPRAKGVKSIARTCSNKCKMDLARAGRDREAFVKRVRETSSRPENIERLRKNLKKRHEWLRTDEGRQWLAERNKKDWEDPYKKAKRSVAVAKGLRRKEVRELLSKKMAERFKDPVMRKKMLNAMNGAKRSPQACAAMSERQQARGRRLRQEYLATEEAKTILRFMGTGMSVCEYARQLGVPRHWVGERVKKIKRALAERNEQQRKEAA